MAEKVCIQGHVMPVEIQFCVHCGGYSSANLSADITAKAANNKLPASQVVNGTKKH